MALIEGNPELRADTIRGILVGEFRIQYERFDNMQAAGKNLLSFIKLKQLLSLTLVHILTLCN